MKTTVFIKNAGKHGEFGHQEPVAWRVEGGNRRAAVCAECAWGSGSARAEHLDASSCNPLAQQNRSFIFLICGKVERQSNLLFAWEEE